MAVGPQLTAMKMNHKGKSPRRSLLRPMNLPLLLVIILLVGFGLLIVHSACSTDEDFNFNRQAIGVAIGFIAMFIIWQFDYKALSGAVKLLVIVNVVLILSPHLPFIGQNVNGAQSWIKIGMQVQPGEFAKVTVLLLAAALVARYGGRLDNPREYCKCVGIMAIPFICIMTQPDLGTGLVYLFIDLTALVMGGARPKFILATCGVAVVCVLLVLGLDELLKTQASDGTWNYKLLKNYQRDRFTVFLNPEGDTSNSGYNLRQAQIAIGSGGFFGKGIGNSTQAGLNFLPEAPTDFIFCVLAEETGFFGVLILLGLYAALFLLAFSIARQSTDLFGMLIVMCTVGMWTFQILENAGMTLGIMPITGIPLPFMSYGSSFMLVNFILLGLIGSVWGFNTDEAKLGGLDE